MNDHYGIKILFVCIFVDYADYCTDAKPCGLGEGDCDSFSNCKGDLVCGKDNCNGTHYKSNYDCCREPRNGG